MRVNVIEKCRKSPGKCGKCGKVIEAGHKYRWAKGRYTMKMVRCDRLRCNFRQSDLTGSDKLSRLYAARESVEDLLETDFESPSDIIDALVDAANEARDVGSEYSEASSNLDGKLNWEELEEKAQQCEQWADALEDVVLDEYDADQFEGDDTPEEKMEAWRDGVRQEVEDALSSLEL